MLIDFAFVPVVWRARALRDLERYVTSERIPASLRLDEAQALVEARVNSVLDVYREQVAEERRIEEEVLRLDQLFRAGMSHFRMQTLTWDAEERKGAERAVEDALEDDLETDWTADDVKEFVDDILNAGPGEEFQD